MVKTYVAALALIAGGLSGCGKSEDPRAVVMSLITGLAPGVENGTIPVPVGKFDFSAKTTTGDDYTLEVTVTDSAHLASVDGAKSIIKFVIGKSADGCTYKLTASVDSATDKATEYDFKKFVGVVYQGTPLPVPMLQFNQCGIKSDGRCSDEPPKVPFADGTDTSRKLLESQAKKMREEICKPS